MSKWNLFEYLLWRVGNESDCDSDCDSDRDRFILPLRNRLSIFFFHTMNNKTITIIMMRTILRTDVMNEKYHKNNNNKCERQ